ncbi:MAG: hypothetical protein ABSA32_11900 [Candidatus Acidiferrales bacterium]|jgi:hypothetical protein
MISRREFVVLSAGGWISALLSPMKAPAQRVATPQGIGPEEYAVYSLLLNSQYAFRDTQQLVIHIETYAGPPAPVVGGTKDAAPRPKTRADTMADFDAKNDKSYQLERRFDVKIPYLLVSEDDLRPIFARKPDGSLDMDCWKRFYGQYPGASGVIYFSRVGLDRMGDQAFAYGAIQSGFVGGAGTFYVLARSNRGWAIQTRDMIWIS